MNYLGECGDDEVVAEFLRAEIDSVRFGLATAVEMVRHGVTLDMLRCPDLTDQAQNTARRMILGNTRGWERGEGTFTGFPSAVTWHRAVLDMSDIDRVYFAESRDWGALSGGSCRPVDMALRIEGDMIEPAVLDVPEYFHAIKGIEAVRDEVDGGTILPPPIVITANGAPRIWLIEGYTRLSGIFLAGAGAGTPVIVGVVPEIELERWERLEDRASLSNHRVRRSLRRVRPIVTRMARARTGSYLSSRSRPIAPVGIAVAGSVDPMSGSCASEVVLPHRGNPVLSPLERLLARGMSSLADFCRTEQHLSGQQQQQQLSETQLTGGDEVSDSQPDHVRGLAQWLEDVDRELSEILGPRAVLGMRYEVSQMATNDSEDLVREEYRKLWRDASVHYQWLSELVAKASEPPLASGGTLP